MPFKLLLIGMPWLYFLGGLGLSSKAADRGSVSSAAPEARPPMALCTVWRPAVQLGSSALRELRPAAHARVALAPGPWLLASAVGCAHRERRYPAASSHQAPALSLSRSLQLFPKVVQLGSRRVVFQTGLCHQRCAFREPSVSFLGEMKAPSFITE